MKFATIYSPEMKQLSYSSFLESTNMPLIVTLRSSFYGKQVCDLVDYVLWILRILMRDDLL